MQVRPGNREPLDPVFAFNLMESSQGTWIPPSLDIAHKPKPMGDVCREVGSVGSQAD